MSGWLLALVLGTLFGLGGSAAGVVFLTMKKKRGWLFLAGGVLALFAVPIAYVIYVLAILICTGRNGSWIC